jgi:hypothetical protein
LTSSLITRLSLFWVMDCRFESAPNLRAHGLERAFDWENDLVSEAKLTVRPHESDRVCRKYFARIDAFSGINDLEIAENFALFADRDKNLRSPGDRRTYGLCS